VESRRNGPQLSMRHDDDVFTGNPYLSWYSIYLPGTREGWKAELTYPAMHRSGVELAIRSLDHKSVTLSTTLLSRLALSRSHGSVRVVRTTSKVNGKC